MTQPLWVRGDGVRPSPWANGGGVTRELYVARDASGNPRWRLSMAEVDGAGEFSHLPGVARSLLLVRGAVELSLDGGPWQALGAPVEFDGATPVAYRAAEPSEDLGAMVWDGSPAGLRVVDVETVLEVDPTVVRALVVIAGSVRLDGAVLGYRDTLIMGSDVISVTPDDHGRVVLVNV